MRKILISFLFSFFTFIYSITNTFNSTSTSNLTLTSSFSSLKILLYFIEINSNNFQLFSQNYHLLTKFHFNHNNNNDKNNNQNKLTSFNWNCLLVLTDLSLLQNEKLSNYKCQHIEFYYGHTIDYYKLLTPSLVKKASYSHILIINSNVKLFSYNILSTINKMFYHELYVVTPIIHNNNNNNNENNNNIIGYTTEIIEFYSPLFTIRAWECFWNMIIPGLNPLGYGYEKYFYSYCQQDIPLFKIGELSSLNISIVAPDPSPKVELIPKEIQFENWINFINNDRGRIVREGNKDVRIELVQHNKRNLQNS